MSAAEKVQASQRKVFCVFFKKKKKPKTQTRKSRTKESWKCLDPTPVGNAAIANGPALYSCCVGCAPIAGLTLLRYFGGSWEGHGGILKSTACLTRVPGGKTSPMVLLTPLELTFHKPCGAGKRPEGWRRASPVPKMRKETGDGPAISEGVGSTEAATASNGRWRIAQREFCWETGSWVRGFGLEHQTVPGNPNPEPSPGLGEGCWGRRAVSSPGVGIPRAEVLNMDIPAHPPSNLETGLQCFCVFNSEL